MEWKKRGDVNRNSGKDFRYDKIRPFQGSKVIIRLRLDLLLYLLFD